MKILLDALKTTGENFGKSFTVADLKQEDQILVYINPTFVKESLYPYEEIIFKNCRFLQGAETDRSVTKEIRSRIYARRPCYADLINYKKNGEKFLNRLLLIPFGLKEDQIRYYIGIQLEIQREDFEQKIYDLNGKTEEIKSDLNDIVNFYRSLEYFDITDENSPRFNELADKTREKISKLCDFISAQ